MKTDAEYNKALEARELSVRAECDHYEKVNADGNNLCRWLFRALALLCATFLVAEYMGLTL